MRMQQKLIFVDLDGTLTPQSTWLTLNLALGITQEEDHALFLKYLEKEIDYEGWISELVSLYKSRSRITREELIQLAQTIELRVDAIATVKALKEKGYYVVVLSGSVDTIVETLAKRVGADEWRSTSKLFFDEQDILSNIVASGDEAPAKQFLAEAYAAEHQYNLAEAFSIDDGGNGVELFKRTKGILLGSNEKLAPLAWKQVATLSEIPALL